MLLTERILGLSPTTQPASVAFLLDTMTAYVVLTFLFVLISAPILFHKGIIFTVISYTLYFWFLFFPAHLFFGVFADKPWTSNMKLPMVLLACVLIAIFVLSLFYFPNHVKIRHLTFTTRKINRPVRIVHLSDIHADNYGTREARIVSLVNKQNADLILVTGDMIVTPYEYNKKGLNAAVRILEQLHATNGIYLVEGHHDEGKVHHIVEGMGDKVTFLRNTHDLVEDNGNTIFLFGASLESRTAAYEQENDSSSYSIYIAHSPKLRRNLKNSNFDLALFGHTHGCQVYIPVVSYFITGTCRHGLYKYAGIPLYVNAGIGMEGYLAPRIRWFTYPEVVIIDLIPESPQNKEPQ
jgi:predicted MPP superfamily phosphohydrolase